METDEWDGPLGKRPVLLGKAVGDEHSTPGQATGLYYTKLNKAGDRVGLRWSLDTAAPQS